ncbi:MAG TPA: hypothetical protein VI216_08605 [Candidatus Acidoferrales bacterium]
MTVFRILARPELRICALAALVCMAAPVRSAQASTQEPGAAIGVRVEDSEQHAGPFAIAGQSYTVVLHEKHLTGVGESTFAQTLAGIEIRDAGGTVAYQETFPYAIEQGRFQRSLSASADIISGKTGAGLVIHYHEQLAPQSGTLGVAEFWQMFGLVNGRLGPLGKPTPIGEGATGGPFMGVMMRAANGTVSVISQPDTIEVRVWTGAFYVFVPLRVDWNRGGLAQGQRCFEMMGGGNREVGCDMRVEGERKPPTEEFSFVRVFSEANEKMGEPEHVVVQQNSKVEILGSSAITKWNQSGELAQPVFSDLWLHVRIDNHTGWIHGDEDFAAVGLPRASPAQ